MFVHIFLNNIQTILCTISLVYDVRPILPQNQHADIFLLYYHGMYVISGENAADLHSIIQMSLDLQAAQETRGKFLKYTYSLSPCIVFVPVSYTHLTLPTIYSV